MAQPTPQGPFPPLQPGQQPTPDQIRQMQQQIAAEAQKAGLSIPEYVERLKAQAQQNHQRMQMMQQQQRAQQQGQQPGQQQMQQQGAQPGQQVPIAPGPPKPEALAVAAFLRGQNLKLRTCIFQEKRKEMFKVKRALRALHSPAYEKARKKNPLLPEVKDRVTAENTFKLLPLSLLALRVSKIDPSAGHEGHAHAPPAKKKRVKGLWTVKVEPQQEARDEFHYVWLYEGSQWKNKLYAVGALTLILAVVFFPVWPYHLRLGVWYLSMGMLGLLGLFFAMAIFRLILFLITMFTNAPGFWLFPNLFEDVGFFDSFKPAWAWHEDEKAVKKRKKEERDRKRTKRAEKAAGGGTIEGKGEKGAVQDEKAAIKEATTSKPDSTPTNGTVVSQQRIMSARVEEVEDD
ncbi:Translocation protein S62 [Elasticomyces elasticus]|nr:Translocation protein S62 [Elasticomyces elasticus]KAK4972924.1 Translocation protein S62 [Elasticomyces elasticus]